ncbi:hypothetical protein CJO81_09695 [Ralstonia solanacearum]|nr:hypothetical protein CJO74_09240 [Ralstonia solanacearum]AXV95825.1 hypothetical protein CJO80_09620 [Ralstonia solanacearum]AXW01024.1 hypothetical protein CJO81_09695 [Ralstonia solanacearum]AXW10658.1 hypothetical protein CJO83_09380 [Ralstonia solanacearum]AXW28512.1 hypothetical protein CJO87_09695 [Ralstonia solanacearum]
MGAFVDHCLATHARGQSAWLQNGLRTTFVETRGRPFSGNAYRPCYFWRFHRRWPARDVPTARAVTVSTAEKHARRYRERSRAAERQYPCRCRPVD